MYLYRLTNPGYLLDVLIETYESLIWTERYQAAGDFELKTSDVDKVRSLLPVGSLVSHQNTKEVVLIDKHEVNIDRNGKRTLTVTGESVFGFLKERAAIKDDIPLNNATTGNPETWELTGNAEAIVSTIISYHVVSGTVDTKDAIPNTAVLTSAATTSSSSRLIPRGSLYDAVVQIIQEQNLGISVNRPSGSVTTMRFVIYQGVDRSATIFLLEANGDFRTTNYIFTKAGSKTGVYGAANRVATNTFRSGTSAFSGFGRRMGLNDASDISSSTTANETAMLTARNKSYLAENPEITAFDCEVSPTATSKMGSGYLMGDVISCISDLGLTQKMRVVEYTWVDDNTGSREYPTLSLI